MGTIDPEVAHTEAAALLARYRAAGVTPDLAAQGNAPRRRTTGTKAERVEQRVARHQRNALAHREAQARRDEERPPTQKQRRLLWCLGYRGPTPKNRAEVAALVAELREQPVAALFRMRVETARSVERPEPQKRAREGERWNPNDGERSTGCASVAPS